MFDLRSFLLSAHSRWTRLMINFGTSGPGRKGLSGGELLVYIFLMASVTLTIKRMIRLRRRTMTAICARTPAFFSPRILGLLRMQRSTLAEELVLSEAERRALSL
jgi:hypothetical protein